MCLCVCGSVQSLHDGSPVERQRQSTLSQKSCDFWENAAPPPLPAAAPAAAVASASVPSAAGCPQVQVESKALQTEEDLQPQRKTSLLQKDLHVTQKVMRDLQRDKWLLEKEFQVWRTAAQSDHDSLEDRCAELEATMEALSQHNQSLEQELHRVRHALSLRAEDPGDVPHPFHMPPSPNCSDGIGSAQGSRSESPTSQHLSGDEDEERAREEEEVTEINQEMEEEESRERSTRDEESELSLRSDLSGCEDMQLPDVTPDLQRQCVDAAEEPLLGEEDCDSDCEEEVHSRSQEERLGGRSQVEYQGSASEEEEEGEEDQLCELVLRLKTSLSLPTHTAGSQRRDVLLVAARGVGDSVSNLVSMVNFYPGDQLGHHVLKCK